MRDGFAHLHVHSNFSMLDGACPIEALVEQAKRLGMEALALTDHDGLYGAIRFYQQAKRAGIKPIIGAELTVEGSTSDRAHHLDRRQGTSPCPTQEECRGARRAPAGIRADSRPPLQETAGGGIQEGLRLQATEATESISSPSTGEEGGGGEIPPHPTPPPQGGRGKCRGDRPVAPTIGAGGGGHHLVLLAKDRTGYSNLCRLVTHAHLSRPRGEPRASISALEECSEGLVALSGCKRGEVAANILDRPQQSTRAASRLAEIFGRENFFIELPADDPDLIAPLAHLARRLRIGAVATNNVHYISPEKAHIHDVLACIGALSTIQDPNPPRHSGGEAYFKSAQEMQARFIAYPEAIAHAIEIADRCNLDLGLGEFHFPHFPLLPGHTADSYLEELCRKGALEKYGTLPAKVLRRLRHELSVIRRLGFSEYFLVVWDIVRWARSQGIRCSGRGSAGDSLVSYLLGLTGVDPIAADLLFERFLNPERKEMPDVDLDFDSRRRDEVIDYVYQRFGKQSVAAVATISTFNARSAIREAGRALGLPAAAVDAVSKAFPHIGADQIREAVSSLPELRGLRLDNRQLEHLFDVCQEIAGFPRHLSVHLGGMVIAPGPSPAEAPIHRGAGGALTDYLPVEIAAKGVAVAQFDKDDIEALGLVKMDLLGLRNLSAVQETIELLQAGGINLDLDKLPLDDPETYRLLRSAQTVGVFQLESPGMRGLLRALQPTRFEDIIANISLFRPGPMQADMIGPFLARRHGKEPVSYPHPATARALKSTYGVILYQEQVLEVASAVAGFTLGESDALRRAMTHDRSPEEMEKLRETFLAGARRKSVDRETAQDVFRSLSAFAAYGFCKAHAACFGHIAYQTAYLKAHYPAEFLAAILSNQPMGFYPPEVIVQEAKHLGIPVLPVDVNRSEARYTVEECFQPETTPFTPTLTLPHQGGGEALCIRATVPAPSPQRGEGLGEGGDTQREETAGHPYDSGQQARLHVAPKLYPGASADRSHIEPIVWSVPMHRGFHSGGKPPHSKDGGPGPFDFAQDRQARPTDGAGRKVLPYAMDVGAERCSARLGSSTAGGGCATWEQQRCSPTERDCRGDRPVAPTQARRAIRVGLAQVQGTSEAAINSILAARKHGPFTSLADFWARANVPRPVAENLIRCGALDSFGPKRALLWQLQALARSNGPGRQMRLFEEENPPLPFRPHTLREEAGLQLSMLGISLKCHPTYFCREQLLRLGVTPSARLSGRPHGSRVKVAGICIARMRPPTKSGQTVIFITLEDETGLSEVTVFERVYQKYGPVIFSNDALLVEGRLQTQGRYGITILAEKIAPLPL